MKGELLTEVQIYSFMKPLYKILDEIESDDVYCDQDGNVLMDFYDDKIESAANEGREPCRAAEHLWAMIEIYYQITAYQFKPEDLPYAEKDVEEFKAIFVEPLRKNEGIKVSSIEKARKILDRFKFRLRKTKYSTYYTCLVNVQKAINDAILDGNRVIKVDDLRSWLYELAKGKTA